MPRALRRLLAPRPAAEPAPAPRCPELADAPTDATPGTPDGCEECLASGDTWVHLRMCLTCGHVGCCDTGPRQHAGAHFRATGHPVMRSFERDETWRWCYVHEQIG